MAACTRCVAFRLRLLPANALCWRDATAPAKTTLLRIAAQIVRPTAGKLSFPGANSNSGDHDDARQGRPGYVAHTTMVYDELTAEENLILFCQTSECRAIPPLVLEDLSSRSRSLRTPRLALCAPSPRGMRQRIAIARALIHRSSVPLLDEPATGLGSPLASPWPAHALRSNALQAGCTVVMSLHGESEISALATRASSHRCREKSSLTPTRAPSRSIPS